MIVVLFHHEKKKMFGTIVILKFVPCILYRAYLHVKTEDIESIEVGPLRILEYGRKRTFDR